MDRSPVTIIVVPRERFSATRASLESIYANTRWPFKLVYVDGGSPAPVARYLREAAAQREFTLLRTEHVLAPNEARNLGRRNVGDARYLVFVDNDVTVEPGWLTQLMTTMEETHADIVGPLYMIGEPGSDRVHMAGGDAWFEDGENGRAFHERHRCCHQPRSEAGELKREPVDFVEFHCMLVRREQLQRFGPFDEELLSTHEHLDFCLGAKAAGARIVFDPDAVVTYSPPRRFEPGDRSYYLLRWSPEWNDRSLQRFAEKWSVTDRATLSKSRTWLGRHQSKAFRKPVRRFASYLAPLYTRDLVRERADATAPDSC